MFLTWRTFCLGLKSFIWRPHLSYVGLDLFQSQRQELTITGVDIAVMHIQTYGTEKNGLH